MVSISTRREDWSIIDPVRDVKYLADRILKEEAKAARSGEPTAKRGLNPHVLAKLMPGDMRVGCSCVCTCVIVLYNIVQIIHVLVTSLVMGVIV